MSFSGDSVGIGDRLAKLVDAGVPVKEAAEALGLSACWCYALLRAAGRPVGFPRPRVDHVDCDRLAAVFGATGSINQAAKAVGVSHSAARRLLVAAGLVGKTRKARAKVQAKARFLDLIESGWSARQAALEVGVHEDTGRDWRNAFYRAGDTPVHRDGKVVGPAGGGRYTAPMTMTSRDDRPAPTGGRYLCLEDRLAIADGLLTGMTQADIAAGIGKHPATVSREVRAHAVDGLYLPYQAHRAAVAARARPKTSKLVVNEHLRSAVQDGLSRRLSPEQISHRLRRDFADDESMRVSHETIYQALYFQARGGLKREVQQALRSGRTRRKPHRSPDQRAHRFVDPMVMISERPAEVADRAVPGHWEGDLIMGEANKTAIATLVERATRYTMLVHLPNGHDAEAVRDGLIATITGLPAHLRGSLTWDQGAEMARHKQFAMATDMAVYFCDPASPWQRGTNENTNGLLRQYFPKGTDLSVFGPEDLEHVAQQLNGRPRKTLDWDTPAERLRDLLLTN